MTDASASRRGGVVAGTGRAGPVAEDPRSIPEMVLDAVEQALADAGVGYAAVDAVVTASVDLFDGLTASNIAVTEVVGAVMKPETRIAADGLAAAIHAACQIWAGAYDSVLVVAHGKPSMAPHEQLTTWAMDPIFVQPLGVDFLTCAGLQARAAAADDANAERRWAQLAAARRRAAADWGLLPACTAEEVLASPVVASPLRRDMCAPLADGACAVLLRARDTMPDGGRQVQLTGAGHDLAAHALGERDLTAWPGLRRACERAYATAGVTDAASAFHVAEPSCRFPHEEALFIEAAGIGARVPVSPAGGLFGGAVPVAAGLDRLIAAAERLAADESCRRALVHGAWGPAGQGQAVAILEAA